MIVSSLALTSVGILYLTLWSAPLPLVLVSISILIIRMSSANTGKVRSVLRKIFEPGEMNIMILSCACWISCLRCIPGRVIWALVECVDWLELEQFQRDPILRSRRVVCGIDLKYCTRKTFIESRKASLASASHDGYFAAMIEVDSLPLVHVLVVSSGLFWSTFFFF